MSGSPAEKHHAAWQTRLREWGRVLRLRRRATRNAVRSARAWKQYPSFDPPPRTELPPPGDLAVLTAQHPVLLSDDNRQLVALMEHMIALERLGMIHAARASETLRFLRGVSVSLLITDIVKPDMSGLDMLQMIREDPALTHIPVLVVSAHGNDYYNESSLRMGALGYQVKPYDPGVFLDALRMMLCSHGNWQPPPEPDPVLQQQAAERIALQRSWDD